MAAPEPADADDASTDDQAPPSAAAPPSADPVVTPTGPLREALRRDVAANRSQPKSLLLVVSYRLASAARAAGARSPVAKVAVVPVLVAYRVLVEWVLGVELPPQVEAGPGLRIRHGQGLVVNPGVVLGADVMLRQNVTIGNIRRGPGETTACPVVEDGAEFGAGAVVVGAIRIGAGALVGANAVVTRDVPPGATVRAARPVVA
jgi:serine acetyltransferase